MFRSRCRRISALFLREGSETSGNGFNVRIQFSNVSDITGLYCAVVPAPDFMIPLLAWRTNPKNGHQHPNICDKSSQKIAEHIFRSLCIERHVGDSDPEPGSQLETGVQAVVGTQLPLLKSTPNWRIERNRSVSDFRQYQHLAVLQRIIEDDSTGTLATQIGRDYDVDPDVTVGIDEQLRGEKPTLHAAISCKWTLRSDRAQNVRHEFLILTRHRRGRLPHLVAVTAEPLPTRIASLARGTGEVDIVYHVLYDELIAAVEAEGTKEQRATLDELIKQDRLTNFGRLVNDLSN